VTKNISHNLQLTYIPAQYWNEALSNFKILSKKAKIPENSSFFLIWDPSIHSEKELVEEMKYSFPSIPVDKLLSCQIRLAIPLSKKFFQIKLISGKIMPIPPTVKLLFELEIIETQDRGISLKAYSNSIKTYALLIKFMFELLNRGNFIPILEPKTEKVYEGSWKLVLKTHHDNERFKNILRNSSWHAYNLPINFIPENDIKNSSNSYKTDGLWHPSYIFSNFIDIVGDILIRTTLEKSKFQTFDEFYSKEIADESIEDSVISWDYKFLKSLIKKERDFPIEKFHEIIVPSIIKNWIQTTQGFTFTKGFLFTFELNYPKEQSETWSLECYVKPLEDNSKPIHIKDIWEGIDRYKKEILKFFENEEEFLEVILRSLGTASKIFPPISQALQDKIPGDIMLTSSDVMNFLRYPRDLLIQGGFNVVLPEVFTRGGSQRLTARMVIRSKEKDKKKGPSTKLPSMFDINSMLDYKWKATLEGVDLTDEEFMNFIEAEEPLISLRGKWILIDQQDVNDLRNLFENKGESGALNYIEALKLGLTGKAQIQEDGSNYDVIIEGNLNDIVEKIQSLENFNEIRCPSSFNGVLRPYQQIGLNWMGNMYALNFGLCLADDMGLGKTIQVIAFLLYLKETYSNQPGSILIICPTSVLFNWKREINKFAPVLDIVLHHGPNRIKDASKIAEYLIPHRIILTSFGTIRNDIDFLQTIPFSGVIIDESQNMKNYASQQTQAIYKLQSQYRLCLSGTPIENRLLELWTLFEFLNPGLLGTRTEFQRNYILPIERFQDEEAINKLKLIISPFMLRRLKSDKSIINDLPEKNEIKVYFNLSERQAILYKDLVEKTLDEIENITTDDRKKRGIVLKLLTQLKQLCNHPHHFLKIEDLGTDIETFLSQSQKCERLLEMIEEVISRGDKALIFTQFKKMGDLINILLGQILNVEILYFHGSVPEKKRRVIVDKFQSEELDSPPILILSLKAGGTGLNLTQGTTVIHYDSPWNPATQDQATDRAYRIGQKSPVNVYKFITIGTIEEKIDALLEEKRKLAKKVIETQGESFILSLDKDKLISLFTLDI